MNYQDKFFPIENGILEFIFLDYLTDGTKLPKSYISPDLFLFSQKDLDGLNKLNKVCEEFVYSKIPRRSGEPGFNHPRRVIAKLYLGHFKNLTLLKAAIGHDFFDDGEKVGYSVKDLELILNQEANLSFNDPSINIMKNLGFIPEEFINYRKDKISHLNYLIKNDLLFELLIKANDTSDNCRDPQYLTKLGRDIKLKQSKMLLHYFKNKSNEEISDRLNIESKDYKDWIENMLILGMDNILSFNNGVSSIFTNSSNNFGKIFQWTKKEIKKPESSLFLRKPKGLVSSLEDHS